MKNIPAFPQSIDWLENTELSGMTLRDFFAAKAMQAEIISHFDGSGISESNAQEIAKYSYVMADALLKQREI